MAVLPARDGLPDSNPNPNPNQARFQRVMEALGVSADLKEKGAANGDLIMVSRDEGLTLSLKT